MTRDMRNLVRTCERRADELPELRAKVQALYRYLHEEGVTYHQMAEATGLPYSTLAMWLQGHREVTKVAMLEALLRGAPLLA